jgi:hypothetical protein
MDLMEKPKPVKLTIYVSEDTRKALRIRAIDEGTTATGLVEKLIEGFLGTPSRGKKGGSR